MVAAALQGARDIIAEKINDDADIRARIRELFLKEGMIHSEVIAGEEAEGAKFKDYFKWDEPLATAPSHRVLAIRRGAAEGFLYFRIAPAEESAIAVLEEAYARGTSPSADQVRLAIKGLLQGGCSRCPMETERGRLESEEEGRRGTRSRCFAQNLRQLLLASPLGQKRVLAIDPGFRTRLQDGGARCPGQAALQRCHLS